MLPDRGALDRVVVREDVVVRRVVLDDREDVVVRGDRRVLLGAAERVPRDELVPRRGVRFVSAIFYFIELLCSMLHKDCEPFWELNPICVIAETPVRRLRLIRLFPAAFGFNKPFLDSVESVSR